MFLKVSSQYFSQKLLPIFSQCYIFIPPENIRKPYAFLMFSEEYRNITFRQTGFWNLRGIAFWRKKKKVTQYSMLCFARFDTICKVLKKWKNPIRSVTFMTVSGWKVTLLHGCFSRFLYCANATKWRKASHMLEMQIKSKVQNKSLGWFLYGWWCIYLQCVI